MKNTIKEIIGWVLAIVGGFILLFAIGYFALFQYSVFAPKYAEINRQVYENTPSYLLGKEQEIAKYRYEYETGDADKKAIIKSVLLQSMAGVDRTKLSMQAQKFLMEIDI